MQGVAAADHPSSSLAACRARAAAPPYASRHAAVARGATMPPVLRVAGGGRGLRPLSLLSDGRRDRATASAAAAAASVPAEDAGEKGDIAKMVQLGAMIVAWYLLNIYFNIYNKQVRHFCNRENQDPLLFSSVSTPTSQLPPLQVLKVMPFPYTITAFQLAFGSLLIFAMWATGLHPAPKLSPAQVSPLLPQGKNTAASGFLPT